MLVIFLKIVLTEHDLIYNKGTTNKPRWLTNLIEVKMFMQ